MAVKYMTNGNISKLEIWNEASAANFVARMWNKGMTSFDVRYLPLRRQSGNDSPTVPHPTTANVVTKVKSAIASAFRVNSPAMALA